MIIVQYRFPSGPKRGVRVWCVCVPLTLSLHPFSPRGNKHVIHSLLSVPDLESISPLVKGAQLCSSLIWKGFSDKCPPC